MDQNTGEQLWYYGWMKEGSPNAVDPVLFDGKVFISSSETDSRGAVLDMSGAEPGARVGKSRYGQPFQQLDLPGRLLIRCRRRLSRQHQEMHPSLCRRENWSADVGGADRRGFPHRGRRKADRSYDQGYPPHCRSHTCSVCGDLLLSAASRKGNALVVDAAGAVRRKNLLQELHW